MKFFPTLFLSAAIAGIGGSMIAGVLVSSVLVFLFGRELNWLTAARAVAFGAIAMGIGLSSYLGLFCATCV